MAAVKLLVPISDANEIPPMPGEVKKRARTQNRPRKKDAADYAEQGTNYEEFIKGSEFLTIPETLNALNTRIIFLLNIGLKSRKLIVLSSETMEDDVKNLSQMIKLFILPVT